MQLAAITRFKHGRLYAILCKHGWTQADFAKISGLSPWMIGNIINLRRRPSEETANRIQEALAEYGEWLDVLEEWPEGFRGLYNKPRVSFANIPMENLLGNKEVLALASPEQIEHIEKRKLLLDALNRLPLRYSVAIEKWFFENETLEEIGETLAAEVKRRGGVPRTAFQKRKGRPKMPGDSWKKEKVSREMVRILIRNGLKRLRSPEIIRLLKVYKK